MASALTAAPPAPTSIRKGKAFLGNVGDKALWIGAGLLAIAVVKLSWPYVTRIPIVGPALASANPGAAFDQFGTAPGA